MADMLKTIPPLFGLPSVSSGWSTHPAKRANPERDPDVCPPLSSALVAIGRVGLEDTGAQLRRALTNGGRRLLLRHFLIELSKVLDQQQHVLSLLETSPSWSLPLLNRQFYAVRTAAEGLKLLNLALVAGRAEVLVNLIDSGKLTYLDNHGSVLRETHRLLRELVVKVLETDSDDACYSITQTVWSMHAALDPTLCEYEPGEHGEHSVTQSNYEPEHG